MKRVLKWVGITVAAFLALIIVLAIVVPTGKDRKPSDGQPSAVSVPNSPTSTLTPVPTPAYRPDRAGRSRSDPAPFGLPVVHRNIEITVLRVDRSWSGASLLSSLNPDQEWIAISLRLKNLGNPDKTENYNPLYFRVTGARGIIYDKWLTPETLNPLKSGEFFGGAELTGDIVQQVHKDDTNLVLIYSQPLLGSRYLSLETTH
jgi:hypothetical protein